jgi:hypothetical protein
METELHINTIFVQVTSSVKCRTADYNGILEFMRLKAQIKYPTCSCSEFRQKELQNGLQHLCTTQSGPAATPISCTAQCTSENSTKNLLLMRTTPSAYHNYRGESFMHISF